VPQQIAKWNPARDVWETDQVCICGHLDVFSGTFPTSGMTVSGVLYGLPTWVPHMDVSGSLSLLPTPAVNDMGAGKTVEEWDLWTDAMRSKHGNGNGHGPSLSVEALRLLPTPTAQDAATTGGPSQFDRNTAPLNAEVMLDRFGDYEPAITRWAPIVERQAPAHTEISPIGYRLSPRFVEWMMGLPEGWVTDVSGVTRNQQLKMLGNGVVPQQATAALIEMMETRP
jgi:DNA (cytosine-5)-methyltransferase 1